ncbi:MAG: hypothetical protein Q7R35_19575, partial [Elusimicrobiota bacterium]|nr:hypothetical protein [Elusimicrobiota bacterium]
MGREIDLFIGLDKTDTICYNVTRWCWILKGEGMTPVIRIDAEVMSELEKRAIMLRKVFGTPNDVLRGILGLDPKEPLEPPIKNEMVIEVKKYFL